MRRFLIFLCILVCGLAIAAPPNGLTNRGVAWIATRAGNGSGAGGGGSLLVNEDMEGTGKPASATDLAGSGGWDNTTAPLAGSQDFKMVASVERDVTFAFTASNEIWATWLWSNTVEETDTGFVFLFGSSQQISVGRGAGTGEVFLSVQESGVQRATTANRITNSTPVKIFYHAIKGTGANAVYDVEFSTNLSLTTPVGSGGNFASYTSGAHTQQFVAIELYNRAAKTTVFQFDNLKVSNTGWPP